MSDIIKVKRGLYINIPTLNPGEFGFCIDATKRLFIGEENGNVEIATQATADALGGRLDTAESDIGTLETAMGTAQGDIDTLETAMGTAQGDIDTLETAMGTAQGDIDTLETAIGALQGGGSTVYLSNATVSNSASADITIPEGYNQYELRVRAVTPAAAVALQMLLSSDGGTTWYGDTNYKYTTETTNSSLAANTYNGVTSGGDAKIILSDSLSTSQNQRSNFDIRFNNFSGSLNPAIRADGWGYAGDNAATFKCSAVLHVNTAINKIRLQMASGNMTLIYTLYGIKESA